jgi:carotenoid cleavage dioxygenase-like enzyme
MRFGRRNTYNVYSRRSTHESRLIGSLPTREPAYMHSFGLTKRFALLLENPLVVNPLRLLQGGGFIRHFRWKPELGLRVHALDRETGTVAGSWTLPARFVFHTINAYEDGNALVLDVCAFEDARIIDLLELRELRAGTASQFEGARPQRLTLPLDGGPATARDLADIDLELPRIDYRRRNMKPYRYVYGNSSAGAAFLKRIVKVDVTDGSVLTWEEPDAWAGEPIFVPRAGGEAEDDGVLLSVVLDARTGRSDLLIFDAATLQELARAHAPHHITFGFHGQFFGA